MLEHSTNRFFCKPESVDALAVKLGAIPGVFDIECGDENVYFSVRTLTPWGLTDAPYWLVRVSDGMIFDLAQTGSA
jgi:hypothetical protein